MVRICDSSQDGSADSRAVSSDHTVHGQTLFVVVMLDGKAAPATSRRGLARMTAAATGLLILVRHGQSTWNLSNQFTGWMDVPLTLGGVNDAQQAGRLLGASGMRIDACYTSGLQRSVQTAQVVCDHLQQQPRYLGRKAIPLLKRYRLNERHYGAITGLSKSAVPPGVSEAELQAWRSTLDGKPPPLTSDNPFHAAIVDSSDMEALRLEGLSLPLTESIRDCCARVEPLWREEIRPRVIERGQTVLVVGHANNLRALIRCVQGLDDDELSRLGVPNGLPLVYEFLSSGRPLPDPKAVGTVPPLTGRYLGLDAIRFEKIDTDRSGTLEVTELNDAGMCILEDGSCDELMQSIDNNGDGRVDFNEYVSWVKRQTNLPTSD